MNQFSGKTCVYDLISEQEENYREVWEYQYRGNPVYYFVPECCDRYSAVYDSECNYLCAPDGGITGQGDGICPDFWQFASDSSIIWKKEPK